MTLLIAVIVAFLAGALFACWLLDWAENDHSGHFPPDAVGDIPPAPPPTPDVGLPETKGRR